jgi:hypothetical protein
MILNWCHYQTNELSTFVNNFLEWIIAQKNRQTMKYKYWAIATFGIFIPIALLVMGVMTRAQKGNITTFKQLLQATLDVGLAGTEGVLGTHCYAEACGVFIAIALFFVWMPFFLIAAFLLALFVGMPVGLAYLAAFAYPRYKEREAQRCLADQTVALTAVVSTQQPTAFIGHAFEYDWVRCALKADTLSLRTEMIDRRLKCIATELVKHTTTSRDIAMLILEYAAEVHVVYEYADTQPKRIVYAGFDEETATSLVKPSQPPFQDPTKPGMPYLCLEDQMFKTSNNNNQPVLWLVRVSWALNRQVMCKLFD